MGKHGRQKQNQCNMGYIFHVSGYTTNLRLNGLSRWPLPRHWYIVAIYNIKNVPGTTLKLLREF